MLLAVGVSQPVQAAETTVEAPVTLTTASPVTMTSEVTVLAGELALTAVPNLRLAPISVRQLMTAPTALHLAAGVVAKGDAGFDGNDDTRLAVEDFRGTSAGWQISASFSPFVHNDGDRTLNISTVSVRGAVTGDEAATLAVDSRTFSAREALIVAAAPETGGGATQVQLTDVTVMLPQTAQVLAGTYRATLTWTLRAAPAVAQ